MFAAASLADAFGEIETAFEEQSPNIDVRLNLAGSSALREQILAGAPGDVFASANQSVMDDVVAGGEAVEPQAFARNSMQIAVATGNPQRISGIADFANGSLLLGACATGVPCGDAADMVFANAAVTADLDTREPDVRALVTKLVEGELDGGIVYRTDVLAEDSLEAIALSDVHQVVVAYPIASLLGSANAESAAAFVDFVLSADGQSILEQHGFERVR